MTYDLTNRIPILYSIDVIVAIKELENLDSRTTDQEEKFIVLRNLAVQGESSRYWDRGVPLIHKDWFVAYLETYNSFERRVLEPDLGFLARLLPLRLHRYMEVLFDGVKYYVRKR